MTDPALPTSNAIVWQRQNLRELPKFRDGTTYLYLASTIPGWSKTGAACGPITRRGW